MAWWCRRVQSNKDSKTYSLRRRLTAATVGAGMLAGLISTVIVITIAWREVNEAYDDTLKESARLVLALGESALTGRADALRTPRTRDEGSAMRRLDYQILARDGTLLARGKDAPKQPFVDPQRRDGRFYDAWVNGSLWRVYVRRHKALGFSVQIGQEWKDRNELIFDALASLAWPLAALWALIGLANWWLIRRLTAPLAHMAEHISVKSPTDLSPVPEASRAEEIRAMTDALNRLLERLSHALEAERRFTADAAHELRTPLAALASRIQLMQRSHARADTSANPNANADANVPLIADLQRLRDDVGRSTTLVEKLLQLARLDPQSGETLAPQSVDLRALIDEVLRDCAPLARTRRVSLEVDSTVSVLNGHHEALFSALRNLVDNAIRYGREGGRVRISVRRAGSGCGDAVILCVQDDGDGVTDDDLQQLTRRFFRVLGSGAPGSGLGLSIVARVVELHGGTLRFGPGLDARGLGVTITLPQPQPQQPPQPQSGAASA